MGPGLDFDHAIRVNAEGTGLLARALSPREGRDGDVDALGLPARRTTRSTCFSRPIRSARCNAAHSPTYSMSKIAQEAVARYCARSLELPVVIARMNASYGPNGGLPTMHFDALLAGNPITTRWDPCTYSPIYQDDINEQTGRAARRRERAGDDRELGGRRGRQRAGVGAPTWASSPGATPW